MGRFNILDMFKSIFHFGDGKLHFMNIAELTFGTCQAQIYYG